MTNDIPITDIKHQSQTITPVTGDSTLVDDLVALVDDPTALAGGPTTITAVQRKAIDNKTPRVHIKKKR